MNTNHPTAKALILIHNKSLPAGGRLPDSDRAAAAKVAQGLILREVESCGGSHVSDVRPSGSCIHPILGDKSLAERGMTAFVFEADTDVQIPGPLLSELC